MTFAGPATPLTGKAVPNPVDGFLAVNPESIGFQSGRFDTSVAPVNPLANDDSNYLESATEFSIEFSAAVAAFGTYVTDVGDFGGSLFAVIDYENPNLIDLRIEVFVPGMTPAENGNLVFFGFAETDPLRKFSSVTFQITNDGNDGVGFDDALVAAIGDGPPPPIPEPATLAMVGLGLLGSVASRRFRRKS